MMLTKQNSESVFHSRSWQRTQTFRPFCGCCASFWINLDHLVDLQTSLWQNKTKNYVCERLALMRQSWSLEHVSHFRCTFQHIQYDSVDGRRERDWSLSWLVLVMWGRESEDVRVCVVFLWHRISLGVYMLDCMFMRVCERNHVCGVWDWVLWRWRQGRRERYYTMLWCTLCHLKSSHLSHHHSLHWSFTYILFRIP